MKGSNKNQLRDFRAVLTQRQIIIILSIIGVGGLLLRLSHVHPDIPIIGSGDAFEYFEYAINVARQNSLPTESVLGNNGWPIFLSFFFQFIDSTNYLDYMLVQKLVGVVLSALTIIPIYIICKRFFSEKLAFVGPVIFVFGSAVTANSLLGLTEPLFVLLMSTALACFFASQKHVVFFTFPLLALSMIVRGEALFIMIPLILLYIIRFRHSRKTVYEIPLLLLIMLLIIAPVATHRIDTLGTDAMFMRAWDQISSQIDRPQTIIDDTEIQHGSNSDAILNTLIKWIHIYHHLLLIPLVFFLPYGIYRIFKRDIKHVSVMLILFFMLIVTINALEITGYGDTQRYSFWMIPLLCIFCTFGVKKLIDFFSNKNLVLIAIIGVVIAYGVIDLENERINVEYRKNGYQIDGIVLEKTGRNVWHIMEAHHMPEPYRIRMNEHSITSLESDSRGKFMYYILYGYTPIYSNITEHVEVVGKFLNHPRDKEFTHMTIDDVEKRKSHFLIHVFQNEDQYPYLTKIYDSRDDGFEYHVKIFEIDYEKLSIMYTN